ncbi:MAG TPA: glycosyltransferase [Spirochaetia bacterium]|nr:glycosyltransferase [Spirochaetia bacterium]
MEAFLLVFAAISAVILCFHSILALGCLLNLARERRLARVGASSGAGGPTGALIAEVIVAVRNEEKLLPRLLSALGAQTRRDCLFLLVDDRSTDATPQLLERFCRDLGSRARLLRAEREPEGLTGKQAALDLAFSQARGDVLLFTDGDCSPPPTWVEEMMRHFADPRTGVVLGRIELESRKGFLLRFQGFEQPLLNQYNFGSLGVGLPTGGFGNNMAVRAVAVRQTGGFQALGFSVTEDAMLLDAVCRGAGWKGAVCTASGAAMLTDPKPTWREYVNQHTRWNAGAIYSADFVTRASYWFVVVFYLTGSLLVLPLGFLDWRVPLLSLTSFVSIGLLGVIAGFYEGRARIGYFLRFVPYLVFFAFFYTFVTLRAAIRRPFEWKGARLAG